jgi:hypothetical protein
MKEKSKKFKPWQWISSSQAPPDLIHHLQHGDQKSLLWSNILVPIKEDL